MTDLILVDPEPSSAWYPFQHSRPVCELRAGAWLIRERWEAIVDGETRAIFAAGPLTAFREDDVPSVQVTEPVTGPAVVARSVFAPSGVSPEWGSEPAELVNDGTVVGWTVPEGAVWEPGVTGWAQLEIDGVLLHGAYDLLEALDHFLEADVADFVTESGDPVPDGSTIIGDPHEIVILSATVEPGVTFDVRHGAIVIEQHAYVSGGTRLEGPIYVGPGSHILGGQIGRTAIGPRCKVRGEVAGSVFLGFANKAHDGFLGDSVVGRWANLGAGTTTSNLKNTYGPVRVEVAGERIETGRQFLGTLVGDHAKSAIGTMFATGTVVGVGANVFAAVRPPPYVAPFAWGPGEESMRLDGFLRIAERVMPRREVEFTPEVREMLTTIYNATVST